MDFTFPDYELVETFRECLGIEVKIATKQSGLGNRAYRCQFGDVRFYQWLHRIGLTPRQSKTLGAIAIPNLSVLRFFRGVFDGDGSMFADWDER